MADSSSLSLLLVKEMSLCDEDPVGNSWKKPRQIELY